MRLLFLAALAALLPTAAAAQDLRRDVGDFERIGDCEPKIEIQRERGEVTAFVVHSQFFHSLGIAMTLEECGAEAQARIARRHGRPDITTPGMDALGESFTEHVWLETVGVIRLRRYGDAPGDKWTIRYEPAARAAVPTAADHFRELKLSLEAVRIRDEGGGVQSYALSGAPCAPVLTQTWIGADPGAEGELVLRGATARTRVEDGRYHLVEISRPGEEPFAFSVDTAARGAQAVAALNALIRACAG
jgi:hypothetical protein